MMMKPEQVQMRVHKTLLPFFKENGFEYDGVNEFKRTGDGFIDRVNFRIVKYYPQIAIIGRICRTYPTIENIWHELADEEMRMANTTTTVWANRADIDPTLETMPESGLLKGGAVFINKDTRLEDIAQYTELFQREYFDLLLPFLQKTADVRWLDEQWNAAAADLDSLARIAPLNGLVYKRGIAAKLAGNAQYEELMNAIRAIGPDDLRLFDAVYKRLKKVKPLADPILARA